MFTLVSFYFFVFFVISVVMYYILPRRHQWLYLLIFSTVFFFFSSIWYTFFYLCFSAGITFLSTTKISKNVGAISEKYWLIFGILGNLSMLVALKYISFVVGNIDSAARIFKGIPMLIEMPEWIAPIGISFYTLSAIGYIADCYWGVCVPSGNFFKDLLFISYWPILTSGPILKYSVISKELYSEHKFSIDSISFGFQRMLWGVIKKIVISTRLGIVVDTIYADITTYKGIYIWGAAVFYMLQLYMDFSGCMDIVIGASECYGIILPENFRTPFFSKSIQEFWQRWHVTLGGWYREYILYPIMNTRWMTGIETKAKKKYGKKWGRLLASCFSMLFVWLLFGLWHGGKWKYVAMGLYFWLLIVLENITGNWFDKIWNRLGVPSDTVGWKALQCIRVFLLVSIGNMFFRLQNIKVTLATLKRGIKYNPWILIDDSFYSLGISRKSFNLMLLGIFVVVLVSLLERKGNVRKMIATQPLVIRWPIYMALLFVPMIFGVYGTGYDANAFIYGGF